MHKFFNYSNPPQPSFAKGGVVPLFEKGGLGGIYSVIELMLIYLIRCSNQPLNKQFAFSRVVFSTVSAACGLMNIDDRTEIRMRMESKQ